MINAPSGSISKHNTSNKNIKIDTVNSDLKLL
jgi:hypothetical protein